jgi:TolB-like protein/DNA-binding winged helix-turn-helix (wHTH) protein/Flp pilus assembly protein TadD
VYVPGSIQFEEFALDLDRYELRRSGRAVKLERMPMELLILLLESEGKLVRRDAINRRLWGEHAQHETEHSVNTAVNKLRFILRDDPRDPRFIQTVVGQGYRFIAKVAAEPEPVVPVPVLEPVAEAVAAQVALLPTAVLAPAPLLDPVLEETLPPSLPPTGNSRFPRRRLLWIVLLLIAICLAAGILTYLWFAGRPVAKTPVEGFHSIAVLPFANLAPNSDQDYIVDGMTDQLITDLAGSTNLRVMSRSFAAHYKGKEADIAEIARSLNIDAILEGSFLHTGKQVRITANLIDTRNDRHLWAQRYEETGDDLLRMQESVTNDIVRQVAAALGTKLISSRLRPVSIKARDAYMHGEFEWNKRTLDSIQKAVNYFQQAIDADPEYAEAYAALGDAYVLLSEHGGLDPAISFARAQDAAEHALRLGGGLAEAHTVVGAVKTDRDWDWAGAEAEYRRAVALNPSYPTAHHWLSLHLSRLGRMQEAEEEIQKARALDPLSPMIATDAAQTAYWARNFEEASKRIDAVLAANPDFAEAYLVKGKILEQQGHYARAVEEFQEAHMLFRTDAISEAFRGHALAMSGASDEALTIARKLEADPRTSGVEIGSIYCALGQPEAAMRWFDKAWSQRDRELDLLGIDSKFDGCRQDASFQALLKKLKL